MEIDSYSNSRKTKDWMRKRYKRIFKDYEINNSTKRIQDRVKWKEVVQKAKTFKQWSCSAWRRRRSPCLICGGQIPPATNISSGVVQRGPSGASVPRERSRPREWRMSDITLVPLSLTDGSTCLQGVTRILFNQLKYPATQVHLICDVTDYRVLVRQMLWLIMHNS